MTVRFLLALSFLAFMIAAPLAAQAQDKTPANDPSLQTRIELARKMHQIKPLDVEIEAAIKQLSMRYPEDKRELFVSKMLQTFDQKALTEISVNAMAATFTAPELNKMIEFYGSPEGKSIDQKMPIYQKLVEPELVKKVDKALMDIRLGPASGGQ